MKTVKNGDTVKVHYKGMLKNGQVFDSSKGKEPLQFEVGAGRVIEGFDKGVLDMQIGDQKTVEIPSEKAYGARNDKMIFEYEKSKLPDNFTPRVGMQLQMNGANGEVVPVEVVEVKDENIVLDANHRLAGKDLVFDIELVEIL